MAWAWRSLRALRRGRLVVAGRKRLQLGVVPFFPDGPGTTGRSFANAAAAAAADTLASPATANAYAHDADSYNKALSVLNFKRRHYLLRDVFDDMLMDGVQPSSQSYHILLSGCMRGSRLQDCLFFFDQMKTMGIAPDAVSYSFVVTTCGKCNQPDLAFRLSEQMEASGITPKLETFVALLATCGIAGDVEKAFDVLRKMTTCGITFNEYCFSALITAYKNRKPPGEDALERILEILQKMKNLPAVDFKARAATGEAEIASELQEEFYSMVTGDMPMRRGFFNRRMMVYHAALRACADLKDLEGLKKVHALMLNDRLTPDAFCVSQMIRGYVAQGDLNSAHECFKNHMDSGKPANLDLYMAMIQGAMVGYTPDGLTIAKNLLRQLDERGFYLNPKLGSDLLAYASREEEGDFSTANLIWDMMQRKKLKPTRSACIAYLQGLEHREIPAEDPRITTVRETLKTINSPFGPGFVPQQGTRSPSRTLPVNMMSNRTSPRRTQQSL